MTEDNKFHKLFAERIRERRLAKGLSATDAAKILGIARTYLSNLESAVNTPNVLVLVAQMGRMYATPTDYLLGNSSQPFIEEDAEPVGAAALHVFYDKLSSDGKKNLLDIAEGMYIRQMIKDAAYSVDGDGIQEAIEYILQTDRPKSTPAED